MQRNYHSITHRGQQNERKLTEFLSRNGQVLLPMVDLIEQSRLAIDELIDVAGRATIETVLQLSAEQVAGRYAQAWALTHYLWNKNPTRMAAYLIAMEEHERLDWNKLFAAYFGDDLNALETAVKAHVDAMP